MRQVARSSMLLTGIKSRQRDLGSLAIPTGTEVSEDFPIIKVIQAILGFDKTFIYHRRWRRPSRALQRRVLHYFYLIPTARAQTLRSMGERRRIILSR